MDYLTQYEEWLESEGKGEKTIIAYLYAVRSLVQWYEERTGDDFNPEEITALDLQDWRSFLQTVKGYSPTTINKQIAAIKTYWAFLTDRELTKVNPTRTLKMKRSSVVNLAPRWLSRQEQAKLLHEIEKEKRDWKRTRDLAIAQTMLQGGLRVSEVSALNVEDVDLKHRTLVVVNGKGGKCRIMPMNRDLSSAINNWLSVRGNTREKALFLSERGCRLTERGIQYQMRNYLDNLGLTDVTVHSLRHSFAKNLIDAGQPLQIVAQLAGHESLETTRRYVTPSEHDLRKAVGSISWDR